MPTLLPPVNPRFFPVCKMTASGNAALIAATESSLDPLSTMTISRLGYSSARNDAKHSRVSSLPFQMTITMATRGQALIFWVTPRSTGSRERQCPNWSSRTLVCKGAQKNAFQRAGIVPESTCGFDQGIHVVTFKPSRSSEAFLVIVIKFVHEVSTLAHCFVTTRAAGMKILMFIQQF